MPAALRHLPAVTPFHLTPPPDRDPAATAAADRAVARWHRRYVAEYGAPALAEYDDPRSRYHAVRARVWQEAYDARRAIRLE